MTDSMKCPFCGAELQTDNEIARLIMWRCHTPGCLLNGWHSIEIIQHLIDGKKAQRQLRTVKDRCVKKVKAKEREIANYLNGMFVREQEIGTLREQLKQAHDALNVAIDALSKIDTFNCPGKGLIETAAGMVSIANSALYEITSITKQEE